MVYLTRRYHLSAAHRLHNGALSPEENLRVYGKCNNPHGHGHNYVLEVTVAGPIDPVTGMVCDLAFLDSVVEKEILERFDHRHLNLEAESFLTRVPTTENLCVEVFNLLRPRIDQAGSDVHLKRVRLEETSSNSFQYEGEAQGDETIQKAR